MFGFFTRRSKKKAAENEAAAAEAAPADVAVAAPAPAPAPASEAAEAAPARAGTAPETEASATASPGASFAQDPVGDNATADIQSAPTAPSQAAGAATEAATEAATVGREAGALEPGAAPSEPTPDSSSYVPTLADVLMGRAPGFELAPPPPEPASTEPAAEPAAEPTAEPAAETGSPESAPPESASSRSVPPPAPTAASPALIAAASASAASAASATTATSAASASPKAARTAAPPPPPAAAAAGAATPARGGWFQRLRQGLARSRGNLTQLFTGAKVDEQLFEDIETALIASDAGVATTTHLVKQLRERARRDRITDASGLKSVLKESLITLLTPLEQPIDIDRSRPLVMMIAGVNGAGKTTSIGKLARHLRAIDQTVLLAAGDTFRAAAREQLARWGERNDVQVIASEGGDPAAVAFDAVKAGVARRTDVVIIDTAGRLPTQTHLMEELKKIRRVLGKAHEGAPHEVLLVLDGNTGQNMLAQVKAFDEAVQLTGLIVTKLDGTAKGGAIAALAFTRRERPIPVYFIGVGEGVADLEAFSAREFASALVD